MSATRNERVEAIACRDDKERLANRLGHTLAWELGPNATRKGHCYYWVGRCADCGAEVSAGACWSSCGGVRDARETRCSGPGTALLTQIETDRFHDLVAGAVSRFGEQVSRGDA